MSSFVENGLVDEMPCGNNFAYILKDNGMFLNTEYKVLQSQGSGCFLKCMKMLYNGRVQLYYLIDGTRSLYSMARSVDPDSFVTIICNLLSDISKVQNNGFLSCRNIDHDPNKIFVDPSTYKVSLVYVPISTQGYSDDAYFENELRTGIIKLIMKTPSLNSAKIEQLMSALQNGSVSIGTIYTSFSGAGYSSKLAPEQNPSGGFAGSGAPGFSGGNPGYPGYNGGSPGIGFGNEQPGKQQLRLVSMNAPQKVELLVNKNDYTIGKRENNDGVISFNTMISRLHCKITFAHEQYWVTDMQSVNGTFLNRVRLQPNMPHRLNHGDILRLANSDFQVLIY